MLPELVYCENSLFAAKSKECAARGEIYVRGAPEPELMDALGQRMLSVAESQPQAAFPQNGHGGLSGNVPRATLKHAKILWDNRKLLFRFAALGLLSALVVAMLTPTKFDSSAQLMPPDSDSTNSMMMAALANKGGDALSGYASNLLGVKNSGAMFIGILQSRTVENALVDKFDLRRVYWIRKWEVARQKLQEQTFISEDRKSGIISIRVRDRQPDRARAMVQAYIDQLNVAVATLSTSAARREREFLETRLQAVKQDLDQAAQDFSQFASKNTAIDIPEQGKAMVEAASRLQGELIAAEAQREGLAQIYTVKNPRVRAAEANIEELRRQLNQLGAAGTGVGGLASGTPLYPSIRQLPLLGVTYAELFRRSKIQEQVYEALTTQYELAKVQEAKEIPTVKVLDPPDYPESKASPHRTQIVAFGILVSFVMGCVWVLGKQKWQTTDPSNPGRAFLQEVGTSLRLDVRRLWRQQSDSWKEAASGFFGLRSDRAERKGQGQ